MNILKVLIACFVFDLVFYCFLFVFIWFVLCHCDIFGVFYSSWEVTAVFLIIAKKCSILTKEFLSLYFYSQLVLKSWG